MTERTWYREGTVSGASGSKNIVGTLTAWLIAARKGDAFTSGGQRHEIDVVTDNEHITLKTALTSTLTGASYEIETTSPRWYSIGDLSVDVRNLLLTIGTVLFDSGPPSNTVGGTSAIYFDVGATPIQFYLKTAGVWGASTNLRGTVILNGSGAPSNGVGNTDDFYIDTTNHRIYGPKSGGAWGDYTSMVGPQGLQGIQGNIGPAGPANTLSIGTVTTGAAGSSASATISGVAPAQTLNLTIPRGDTGASGSGSGNVTGPASSVVGNLALFNDTSGTLLKDGGALSAAQQALVRANIITAPVDASASLGLCVNPFFEVSQENGTTLQSDVGSSGKYAADQWLSAESAATLVMSAQQVATPFSSTAGFKRVPYSVKAIATTAQASLGSSEVCTPCRQTIEGTFWKTLGWGGGDGVDAVVVGVVMASVTGTYPVTIRNAAGARSMVKTVSLTANTPAVIYETFSADTSGTWVTSALASAIIEFGTTSGSTYETSTLGSWQSADYRSATTATDWQGTLNAFVQVAYLNVFPAGVLPWTSASEITGEALQRLLNMRRPFDEELRRCQRYWAQTYTSARSYIVGGYLLDVPVYWPAPTRTSTPSVSITNGTTGGITSTAVSSITSKGCRFEILSSGSGDTYHLNATLTINDRM